ncbi:MAG: ribonuclease III [Candidatus Daviesbacteria bacterium]|nr:ribonuclease III [Candidatus Daviesbacteria bacterium]
MRDDYSALLVTLGLKFKNPNLLQQAFIHRSFLNENKGSMESNERLEFLGDSVLSLIVSSHLFKLRRNDEEGDLTNLRSFIVKTGSLATAASELHLGDYLQLSHGEEMGGGRLNPQLMANTYEALLGAVYLDQGLEAAGSMVEKTLLPFFEDQVKSGPPKDAKSELQEVAQNQTKQSPQYRIIETKGPDHAKEFTVAVYVGGKELGKGIGNSKQTAEEQAAKEALSKLG